MKFLTNNGVGQILGNQKLSKRCYLLQLRQRGRHLSHIYQASGRLEEIHLVDIEAKFSETRDDFDIQPEFVEETIAVHLGSYEIVQIWSFPCGPFKDQVVLWENQDIFMWKPSNMGGIDPTDTCHQLKYKTIFRTCEVEEMKY